MLKVFGNGLKNHSKAEEIKEKLAAKKVDGKKDEL